MISEVCHVKQQIVCDEEKFLVLKDLIKLRLRSFLVQDYVVISVAIFLYGVKS